MGLSSPNEGIIISRTRIVNAKDISHQALPFTKGRAVDVGVELTLDIGKSFNPTLTIYGDFEKDASGTVVKWGSAFKVHDLLMALCPEYVADLKENYRISPDALTALMGKEFLRLTYVIGVRDDGKIRYSDWTTIGTVEAGEEALKKRWTRSIKSGYPSNFHPEVLESHSTALGA
jgi:hypothetical protein